MSNDSRYQVHYKELGNERVQSNVPENLTEIIRRGQESRNSPFEVYWTLRRLVIYIIFKSKHILKIFITNLFIINIFFINFKILLTSIIIKRFSMG